MGWLFERYADFKGRSGRVEYWQAAITFWVVFSGTMAVDVAVFHAWADGIPTSATLPLNIPASLILFTPTLAVQVRRLHDLGRSGIFILLNFLPIIGGLFLIVWLGIFPGLERSEPPPVKDEGGAKSLPSGVVGTPHLEASNVPDRKDDPALGGKHP